MMQLVDPKLGLYQSETWTEGTPGLFAVIIGVSEYTHVDDGAAPAKNTYGFGQLGTSTLTAYQVFRWLCEHYDNDEAPLARCWVLLAPSREETDLADADAIAKASDATRFESISGRPTFANCRSAIISWRDTMLALGKEPDPQSRAVFFFSGHGIQANGGPLLLPSDWLGPDAPTANYAISVENLTMGLTKVPVLQQWFFCDACRSTNRLLDDLRKLEGTEILDEHVGEVYDRSYPVLFATAGTKEAFEPRDVRERTTYFGGALLDGFLAKDPAVVTNIPRPCVRYDRLATFVSADTRRRLAAAGIVGTGPRQGGEYATDDPTVTYVQAGPRSARPSHSPTPIDPAVISQEEMGQVLFSGSLKTQHFKKDTLDSWLRATASIRSGASSGDVERAFTHHLETYDDHLFGSERLTDFFELAKAIWWDDAYGTARDGAITYTRIRRSEDARSLELAFTVEPAHRDVWVEWRDSEGAGGDGSVFGTMLPREVGTFIISSTADAEKRVDGLAIFAGREPESRWQHVDQLYRLYRTLSPIDATRRLDQEFPVIRDGLLRKREDPLGALEAALILLRTSHYGALYGDSLEGPAPIGEDWLSNLAEWFEYLGSDACVLVAQRLVSDPNGARANEERTRKIVGDIAQRGLPRTAEARRYLLNLVRLVRVGSIADRVNWISGALLAVEPLIEATHITEAAIDSDGLVAMYGASKVEASVTAYESVKYHQLVSSSRGTPVGST